MATVRRFVRTMAAVAVVGVLGVTGCAKQPAADSNLSAADAYARGAAAFDGGNRQAAVADFNAALAKDPNHLMARERLGDAYRDLGQYEQSLAAYSALVKSDPYTASSWRKLGIAQQFLKQYPAAADSYARALRLDANDWEARSNLGVVRLFEGNLAGAEAELKTAVEGPAAGKAQAWTNYAAVLDVAGKSADAEAAYRKAVELKPDDASLHRQFGDLLKKSGKQAEADEQYKLADTIEKKA